MTSKHTPGPWALHLVDDTTVIDRNGRFVASVCGGDDDLGDQDYNNPDEWPVLEANARLIAAAPDMLAALKALLSDYDGWSGHNDDGFSDERLATARAAIAKAEGRS